MLAPDAEELVVSYLAQFFPNVSVTMPAEPPLPFYLVTRISGGDDMVTDYATVSVHAFASDRTAASDAARAMHDKMRNLNARIGIPVSNGTAGVDRVETKETPAWRDYDDANLQRYVGRYGLDLRLKRTQ